MTQGWGIIITVVIFGVGQLAGMGVLIFHIGSKFQQLNDHERRIGELESQQKVLVPLVSEIRGSQKTNL